MRKTLDSFEGYPVQVVHLKEHYPKRQQRRTESCWIVTTDLTLSLEELREAAHERWEIENNVFYAARGIKDAMPIPGLCRVAATSVGFRPVVPLFSGC